MTTPDGDMTGILCTNKVGDEYNARAITDRDGYEQDFESFVIENGVLNPIPTRKDLKFMFPENLKGMALAGKSL